VLLFAIVLGLTAVASSVAPPREAGRTGGPPATTEAPPPPPVASTPPLALAFAYPAARPGTKVVTPGSHVVVTVRTGTPGEAAVPRLGLTADAEPATPASFDVLFDSPGRYDVLFQPPDGDPARLGTVVVRE
jgi:hypothetical protein